MKNSSSFFLKCAVVALAGVMFQSCGSASFNGSGDGTHTNRTQTLQQTPAPVAPLTPRAPVAPTVPTVQVPQNTTTDTVQTIGGIVNTIRNNIDVSRTDREVIFGGDKVFHIGDGRFPASSCQSQLKAYALSGTKYSFNFSVLEDGTRVELDLLTVCGVDYSNSNYLTLIQTSGASLERELIRAGASRADLNTITLNKGQYAITVESTMNNTVGVEGGDNDDFIVGGVRIRASKNITAGDVRVQ